MEKIEYEMYRKKKDYQNSSNNNNNNNNNKPTNLSVNYNYNSSQHNHSNISSNGMIKMIKASYKYPDGSEYKGEWNSDGQRNGFGVLTLNDGTKYMGEFENGLCHGLGVMTFADGSKYEGEFYQGKYNHLGIFTRCDKMKYEGEFRDGRVIGRGLLTFTDGTHGLPRNEGIFEGNKLIHREKCTDVIAKANLIAKNANKLISSKMIF